MQHFRWVYFVEDNRVRNHSCTRVVLLCTQVVDADRRRVRGHIFISSIIKLDLTPLPLPW